MTASLKTGFLGSLGALLAILCIAQVSSAAETPDVVAVVGGVPISRTALEARAEARSLRARSDLYSAELSVLTQMMDEALLSREAQQRGMTVSALLDVEINSHVQNVTDQEARAVVENSSTYQSLPSGQAVQMAKSDIRTKRLAKLRTDFLDELRKRTPTEIHLDPPRLAKQIAGGQTSGPDSAIVSIIEFSDFQCPYCAQLSDTLKRLQNEYSKELRVSFKQFPLAIHPQAELAAQASLCAAQQGKFGAMHDVLFANQQRLAAGMTEFARQASLDLKSFEDCLTTSKVRSLVNEERAEAAALGLTATPTFFVNGRMFTGAMPYATLRAVVEEELKRQK